MGVICKPNGSLSFQPLASTALSSRMLMFLQFTNMTRTRHALSGILPLRGGGKKENLKAVFYCQENQSIL